MHLIPTPSLLVHLVLALVSGLLCVLRPEVFRSFVARYRPGLAGRFRDAEAHRSFIRFCGWALLATATFISLNLQLVDR